MAGKTLRLGLLVFLGLLLASTAWPQAKMKVGTAGGRGTSAHYFTIFLVAQQQGLWKQNGLDVEQVEIRGASTVHKALAAGSLQVGMSSTPGGVGATARGVPSLMVYGVLPSWPNGIYVRADSRIKKVEDLAGAKIGIVRFGGMNDAYGKRILSQLGLADKVKWLAAGGGQAAIAGLRAGSFDAIVRTESQMIKLLVAGQVRQLTSSEKFLPKKWIDIAAFALKSYIKSNADDLTRWAKAMTKATDYVKQNRDWAIKEMMAGLKYPRKAAELMYPRLQFFPGGRIEKEAVVNVRNFLIEYRLVKGKIPPADQLFTNQFTQ